MKRPNRVKIVFDGGEVEIYGDIFSDILTAYQLAMYARKDEANKKASAIKLSQSNRLEAFKNACFEYDDAESRLEISIEIEKVFKNRSENKKTFIQERENA